MNNDDNINDINDVNITNYGEKSIKSRLIVMDDVSELADLSTKFANFLTVARKFGYHCLYIFHAIHPEKAIWRTNLSQTNLLNIIPASVPLSTVKKVLEANCIRNSNKYIPVNSLWVTKLFIRLFEIDGLKTSTDNATYNPSLELENLQRNGLSNVRNNTDEQDGRGFEQSKFRPKWKSARPKISAWTIRTFKKKKK